MTESAGRKRTFGPSGIMSWGETSDYLMGN
jgi:hypothetical protein